jgi:methylenetetrahydrofolate dehydrogenase (NADP+)/methenyltetrahydrofolate cyclohydrolase
MDARIIDGKAHAAALRAQIAAEVTAARAAGKRAPGLAVALVGEDPASQVYVRNKAAQTVEAGMESFEHRLPATTTEAELLALIAQWNADPSIDGILVQLPLPPAINAAKVLEAIDPAKDVDGFHPMNVGRLAIGATALVPCTPLGCLLMLRSELGDLAGLQAIVLGRSTIVGRPMAALLLQESCTVTIAHSKTRHLPEVTRRADIVVAAIGRPQLVTGAWIKPGATVIDVGINRVPTAEGKTRLGGDVEFDSARAVAGAITPVPGGVGPMTIACLLRNTLTAYKRREGLPE